MGIEAAAFTGFLQLCFALLCFISRLGPRAAASNCGRRHGGYMSWRGSENSRRGLVGEIISPLSLGRVRVRVMGRVRVRIGLSVGFGLGL